MVDDDYSAPGLPGRTTPNNTGGPNVAAFRRLPDRRMVLRTQTLCFELGTEELLTVASTAV